MLISVLLLAAAHSAWAIRGEHRVHNIILNPEKYAFCQTTRIQQIVSSPGYEPVTIENNVCVGLCYSYSIPRVQPAEPGELIGPYCDSCQPIDSKCYHVTLQADSPDAKPFQKRVQIIKQCSCQSCEKVQKDDCDVSNQTTSELPHDLFSNRPAEVVEDVPELLNFQTHVKLPHIMDFSNDSSVRRFELSPELLNLLKTIQEDSNVGYAKEELRELLKLLEGPNGEVSDKSLMEFVNFVNVHNSEDFELDLAQLKEVLVKFKKHEKLLEVHRDFGLANNQKIEQDLQKLKKGPTYGLEAGQIRHHLGEEVHVGGDVGRLVKGPHGSMVVAPNLKVEEKLDIDSDVLKPNHDGVVISYENHRKPNEILTN